MKLFLPYPLSGVASDGWSYSSIAICTRVLLCEYNTFVYTRVSYPVLFISTRVLSEVLEYRVIFFNLAYHSYQYSSFLDWMLEYCIFYSSFLQSVQYSSMVLLVALEHFLEYSLLCSPLFLNLETETILSVVLAAMWFDFDWSMFIFPLHPSNAICLCKFCRGCLQLSLIWCRLYESSSFRVRDPPILGHCKIVLLW